MASFSSSLTGPFCLFCGLFLCFAYSFFCFELVTARSELQKVLFLAPSVWFLFMYEISLEPLNGLAPNSHGRRVLSLAQVSFKMKVTDDKNGIFQPFRRPACGLCLVKRL